MMRLTIFLAGLFCLPAFAQQCIPSGVTDQYTYFVAVDATDFTTRETGLATWTVYRSRNGGAAAAFTTPTINETDTTNMPGTYELLLDEDMTIDAGDDVQHMALHITHAGMAPVTKEICIARPKITAGSTSTAQTGDSFARLGAPAGASIAADLVTIDDFVDGLESSLGTPIDFGSGTSTIAANLQDMADNGTAAFDRSTDSLQAIRDRGDAAWITGGGGAACNPETGCIADGTAQAATSTTIQLAAAETFADDEIIGAIVQIESATAGTGQARIITDYVSSTDTATVDAWTTTPTGTILYNVFSTPPGSTTSPAPVNMVQISGDVTAADNAESFFDGTGYAGTGNVMPTVTTLTGHTAQTGDSFARLGAPAGASVSADIAVIDQNVDDIEVATRGQALLEGALLQCEVNTANFAGSSTTLACILTDLDSMAVTQASGDLEGLEIKITSGDQIREGRFIEDTTWDAANSELQLTLSRALPATLADAVTAIIR